VWTRFEKRPNKYNCNLSGYASCLFQKEKILRNLAFYKLVRTSLYDLQSPYWFPLFWHVPKGTPFNTIHLTYQTDLIHEIRSYLQQLITECQTNVRLTLSRSKPSHNLLLRLKNCLKAFGFKMFCRMSV
jgi:hypothetical protein